MNTLYPVFLKIDQLPVLLVGAGRVGSEKLSFILKSSPRALVTVLAPDISRDIEEMSLEYPSVHIVRKSFEPSDLDGFRLVIAGTANPEVNRQVWQASREYGILANIADTPELCDFYLGSIVTKGNLKVAISTNGTSPTFAKRLREVLEETLPDQIDEILIRLKEIRQQLKGDFEEKIRQLDEITKVMKKG